MKPPIGGWAVTVRVRGRRRLVSGTPKTIAKEIYDLHVANDLPMTEQKVWDWLNVIWQNRDPTRAVTPKKKYMPPEDIVGKSADAHVYVGPDTYGPSLWGTLNIFGMKGEFSHEAWISAIDNITNFINPQTNPSMGCEECFSLWSKIRLASPPVKVDNIHDAARWVWAAHNSVNKSLKKPQPTFAQAVRMHNWAFSVDGNQVIPV